MYIGQSTNIEIRWGVHKSELRGNYHINTHLQRSWNKYGEEYFDFIILEELPNDRDILDKKEKEYINKYNTFKDDFHFNVTPGGEGFSGKDHPSYGMHHTEEAKKRISMKNKGKNNGMYGVKGENHPSYGLKLSEKQKKIISEANKRRFSNPKNHPMYGKTHTLEARKKISKAQIGRHRNEKTCKTLSKLKNTTGLFRVTKIYRKDKKHSLFWVYQYYENFNQKRIMSLNLKELESKVKELGLKWEILDEDNAMKSYAENELQQNQIKKDAQLKDTTGFYKTKKQKEKALKQGFKWRYYYKKDGKQRSFASTDLNKLKQKVKEHNLEWRITDYEKAKKSIEENNKYHT